MAREGKVDRHIQHCHGHLPKRYATDRGGEVDFAALLAPTRGRQQGRKWSSCAGSSRLGLYDAITRGDAKHDPTEGDQKRSLKSPGATERASVNVGLVTKAILQGHGGEPWIQNYTKLCAIGVDVSHLPIKSVPKENGGTGTYWRVDLTYVLCFSAVELRAHIAWIEEGVENRSPATIIYEPNDV
ncbi:hypothetical protein NMY22_g14431 [Coprinellus aureogranulatus]|nr:hypothetical protein NMY22_g14431 [Coprinellus aureogranulatus]